MPVHDWARVDAGLFHHFHQSWSVALANALNAGVLPENYFALVEQQIRRPVPDVLTLKLAARGEGSPDEGCGLAVAVAPPRTRLVRQGELDVYAARANRVVVRHRHGDIVAVVELISPGNKASRAEFRSLVVKATELIRQGVNLLVVDLFRAGPRDPDGIHKAIWDAFLEEEFERLADKPFILAAYDAGPPRVAYVDSVGVGDALPDMPVFLAPGFYVPAPLETTYQSAWSDFPTPLKRLFEEPSSDSETAPSH